MSIEVAVTMTPQHLLVLCLFLLSVYSAKADVRIPERFQRQTEPPDFWWDLTLDHYAPIRSKITPDAVVEGGTDPELGGQWKWSLEWAKGVSATWRSGDEGRWTTWMWQAKSNNDISGGGFIHNTTGDTTLMIGASWLLDKKTGEITWNCFADGNGLEPAILSNWTWSINEDRKIGFVITNKSWGFTVDSDTVLSDHCTTGHPIVGKRYKVKEGNEVETSVQEDPYHRVSSSRRKRSPQFFESVVQTAKDWFQKVKNFFMGGEGRDGQKCNTFLDLFVRVWDLIFGNTGVDTDTSEQEDSGSAASDDSSGDADSPSGAEVTPSDAEEIDPSQNDAVRDWE